MFVRVVLKSTEARYCLGSNYKKQGAATLLDHRALRVPSNKNATCGKKLDEEGIGSFEPIPLLILLVCCQVRFACRGGRRM